MFTKPHHQVAFWLIVSAGLLAALIPGGPIENRDFSHIHPGILGVFNVFLTTLDFGSAVLAHFVRKRRRWALNGAFVVAIAFFAVYAVDLAQVFPKSPTPMSFALALIEVLGISASVPLMIAARRAVRAGTEDSHAPVSRTARFVTITALVVTGIAIVFFATDAAMHGAEAVVAAPMQIKD